MKIHSVLEIWEGLHSPMILLEHVDIWNPRHLGIQDILICGTSIIAIAPKIEFSTTQETTVINGEGMTVVPGFIDQHVHILGGGGEDGYGSRIPEILPEECLHAGTTTLVGLLGTDTIGKNIAQLIATARKLFTHGFTVYCLSGGYAYPPITLTGSVGNDLFFIPEIIGVKTAISDSRSSNLTVGELGRLASEVRGAAMLSRKVGIVVVHLGKEYEGFSKINEAIEVCNLPITQIRPTHVGRHLEGAISFAKRGGYIDFTATVDGLDCAKDIVQAIDSGVPTDRITISSDANGSIPVWGEDGSLIGTSVATSRSLMKTVTSLIDEFSLDIETAISFVTCNVSVALGMAACKGSISVGSDADLLIVDDQFHINKVMLQGEIYDL